MGDFLHAVYDIFSSEATYGNGALFAAFLAFAATGEWVAERSGTLNISVEGMLLVERSPPPWAITSADRWPQGC